MHRYTHYPCMSGHTYRKWKPTLWISAHLRGKIGDLKRSN